MPVTLSYRIPKNTSAPVADQLATFSSLELNQGELAFLQLEVTADATIEQPTYLERNLTLTEEVPGFVNAFGPSENPALWNIKALWANRIAAALQTQVTTVP